MLKPRQWTCDWKWALCSRTFLITENFLSNEPIRDFSTLWHVAYNDIIVVWVDSHRAARNIVAPMSFNVTGSSARYQCVFEKEKAAVRGFVFQGLWPNSERILGLLLENKPRRLLSILHSFPEVILCSKYIKIRESKRMTQFQLFFEYFRKNSPKNLIQRTSWFCTQGFVFLEIF